ncbi:TLC domain-containing protein 5-like [Haliotis rufescens]|uniref:TLC domain-containing protein 5-like n=1 Tax=Haliotis rufescens TaxID=6454 RepID=UPI00201F7D37|nr:TLC domain-containing protein 5-like [Haliotis rufescens]
MTLLLVLCCLGLWTLLYLLLCRLNPGRRCEWHCRSVTAIHALLITSLAAWCSFIQGPWPFTHAGGPNTPLQYLTTSICLGYFIFDFSWCLYFKTEGPAMMAHHALSIFGLTVTLVAGKYGTELVATICGAELTNPLLQLRWFLRETGQYHTIVGEIVDILFMGTFGMLRIGVGSVLLYSYFQQPTDFFGRLGGVCIYAIGWVFWIAIVQYAIKKYTKRWNAWKRKRKNNGSSVVSKSDSRHETLSGNSEMTQTADILVGQKVCSHSESLEDIPSQGELKKPNGYLRVGKPLPPSPEGSDGIINGIVHSHISCLVPEADKKNV